MVVAVVMLDEITTKVKESVVHVLQEEISMEWPQVNEEYIVEGIHGWMMEHGG